MSYNGKRLKINLNDTNAISNAMKIIRNYTEGNIDKNAEKFVEKMVDEGVKLAKSYCPVDQGTLKGSIRGKVEKTKYKITGKVIAGTDHAAFVEFGTGVVGQGTHPNIGQTVYAYDVNNHAWDGDHAGDGGWYYYNEKLGHVVYTRGHVANPFMYKTARDMRGYANRIAGEVIGQ